MLDILFALCAVIVGGVGGWLLNAVYRRNVASAQADAKLKAARNVISHLHTVVSSVADGIGEHNLQVEKINHELTTLKDRDASAVVAAVNRLIKSNGKMQQRLEVAEKRLQSQAQELESQAAEIEAHAVDARTDGLTNLHNRRAFDDTLQRLVEASSKEQPFSLVLLDIDHFKSFNDVYGHQAGDEVLRQLAELVRRHKDGLFAARYGGEEFALLLPGTSDSETHEIVESLRRRISECEFPYQDVCLRATASFGHASFRPGETTSSLIQRCDEALYSSKEAGRDCCHFHDGMQVRPVPGTRSMYAQPVEIKTRIHTRSSAQEGFCLENALHAARSPDSLAALANRSMFVAEVERRFAEQQRRGTTLSVLFIRLDLYREIVERHGTTVGLNALRTTARSIHECMRDMDMLARHDESTFSLLLPLADADGAEGVANRIAKAIRNTRLASAASLRWTVSIAGSEVRDGEPALPMLHRLAVSLETLVVQGGNLIEITHDNIKNEAESCRQKSSKTILTASAK